VTGRCARNTGRAEERRAREAARGKNEAIVKTTKYDEVSSLGSVALVLLSMGVTEISQFGVFFLMASCRIRGALSARSRLRLSPIT
jgi:hypothetical protein